MKIKLGIFCDTHGNLPALKAIHELFKAENCLEIIHAGDMVTMGAYSKECLQYFFSGDITLLVGNHDLDYARGQTLMRPGSHVIPEHKQFVFGSIGSGFEKKIEALPRRVFRSFGKVTMAFQHYALAEPGTTATFKPICHDITAQNFDELFDQTQADVIFFGHKHDPVEICGEKLFERSETAGGIYKKLYVDIGSVGCHAGTYARGIILEADDASGLWSYRRVEVPYDRKGHFAEMERRGVPDAKFIQDLYFREAENRGEDLHIFPPVKPKI